MAAWWEEGCWYIDYTHDQDTAVIKRQNESSTLDVVGRQWCTYVQKDSPTILIP